jgi:hypothetical protein
MIIGENHEDRIRAINTYPSVVEGYPQDA